MEFRLLVETIWKLFSMPFCDPAIKMMCTDCPDFRPGSSAPRGLSLPAEWSWASGVGGRHVLLPPLCPPPSVNTHLTNRVQLPLSQSWNHNRLRVSQLFEPKAVQSGILTELHKPVCGSWYIRLIARKALVLGMK